MFPNKSESFININFMYPCYLMNPYYLMYPYFKILSFFAF